MPDIKDAGELQKYVGPLQSKFRHCWNVRGGAWLSEARRQLMPIVPEYIYEHAMETPILSPKLEENTNADVQILTQHRSEIEVQAMEHTDEADRDAEDERAYYEVQYRELNRGKSLEAGTASHLMWPDGVAVWRLDAQRPNEYGGEEEGDAYNRARQKYFEQAEHKAWKLHLVNPRTTYWWPLLDENKTEFLEDAYVDLTGLTQIKVQKDGQAAIDLLRSLPGHRFDEANYQDGPAAHIVYYEYKAQDGGWWHLEYLYPMGGTLAEHGTEIKRYKLPHKESSYTVIPAGTSDMKERTDPHYMFRPKNYTLGVEVERLNTAMTMKQAALFTQLTDKGVTLNVAPGGFNEEARRVFDRLLPGWALRESLDSDELLTATMPERSHNQLLIIPGELRVFPGFQQVILSLDQDIGAINAEIRRVETNPFLTGRAFETYQEGTSTATSLGTQRAAVPYGPHREQIDNAWGKQFRKMRNCMITWDDESEGKPIPFTATMSSEDYSYRPGKGNQVITMDARKARRHVVIKVFTRVETFQEQMVREQAALADYNNGHITFLDYLRQKGHRDPRRYAFELAREGHMMLAELENAQVFEMQRKMLLQEELGLNLAAIAQEAQMLAQPGGQPTGAPPGGGNGLEPLPNPGQRPGGVPTVAGAPPEAVGV